MAKKTVATRRPSTKRPKRQPPAEPVATPAPLLTLDARRTADDVAGMLECVRASGEQILTLLAEAHAVTDQVVYAVDAETWFRPLAELNTNLRTIATYLQGLRREAEAAVAS